MPMMNRAPMMGGRKPMGGSPMSPLGKMGGGMPMKPMMDKPGGMSDMGMANAGAKGFVRRKISEALSGGMSGMGAGMGMGPGMGMGAGGDMSKTAELRSEVQGGEGGTPLLDKLTQFYDDNYELSTDSGAEAFDRYASDTESFMEDINRILTSESPESIKDSLHADAELMDKDGGDMMAEESGEMPLGESRAKPPMPMMAGIQPPMGGGSMASRPPAPGGAPPLGMGGGMRPTVGNGDAMNALSRRKKRPMMGMGGRV